MDFQNKKGTGDFENPKPGPHISRIVHVIDLGTHASQFSGETKMRRKVLIGFELADKMEDGRPFLVNQRYNQSMNEKATLRLHLEGWAGKKMIDEQADNFKPESLLGKACVVQLVEATKGDKTYCNVKALMALMAGQVAAAQVNPSVLFDLDNFDPEVYAGLTKWTREKIAESPEYKALKEKSLGPEAEHEGGAAVDDDIPF